MLTPIEGFEKMPLVSLEEAVKPLVKHLPDIERQALMAKQRCKVPPAHGLSIDESASIRLYTMECKPHDQCLYFVLNRTLRSENRNLLKDWFLYLMLIISSLMKIPSIPSCVLFRGTKLNLSHDYPAGQKVLWWAFSSCTTAMEVLENGPFLGKTGPRTLFKIDCDSGRDIREHSTYPKENEVLLIAAREFCIVSVLDAGHGLHIIHLKETKPKFPLIAEIPVVHASDPISADQVILMPTYRHLDLERHIAKCPYRSSVTLNGYRLTDQDMEIVVQQAILDKQCVKLSLQNNTLTCHGLSTLAMGVRESIMLEELDLSSNHLSNSELGSLVRPISVHQTVRIEQWKCCGMVKVKVSESRSYLSDFVNAFRSWKKLLLGH